MAKQILFSRHPAEGVLVAQFIADFSTSELALSTALSRFLGPSGLEITSCMFHEIRSISNRMDAFERLVGGLARPSGPCLLLECIKDLKNANSFRNKIAHGVWGEDGEPPQLTLNTWLTSTSRKSEKIVVTETMLREELASLQRATGSLFRLGVGSEPLPEISPLAPRLEDHIQVVRSDQANSIPPDTPQS